MKAMRLTRNEHHRKLRVPIRNISDWLVNADVSNFHHHILCSECYPDLLLTMRLDTPTFIGRSTYSVDLGLVFFIYLCARDTSKAGKKPFSIGVN
jgi:hypothetical protein